MKKEVDTNKVLFFSHRYKLIEKNDRSFGSQTVYYGILRVLQSKAGFKEQQLLDSVQSAGVPWLVPQCCTE